MPVLKEIFSSGREKNGVENIDVIGAFSRPVNAARADAFAMCGAERSA
ncbi:hypothetical protein ABU614_09205 [Lysobacter firmicutimachus]|uniref:Uncharacterized protein n=1 Tax=Lysobacter firmicutimachus TaxID=1792846 RepID=A0AAU8N0C0_9GAMM